MRTVFLSFAGAEPRGTSHAVEWGQRLRDAGFEVIDHERFVGYDLIMTNIARCDAMVALVRPIGSTWSSIEITSAAWGRDTFDSSHGSWPPKPTLLWFVDPVWDDSPRPRPIYPYLTRMLAKGQATRLPDDFEAAVAHAVGVIGAAGSTTPAG